MLTVSKCATLDLAGDDDPDDFLQPRPKPKVEPAKTEPAKTEPAKTEPVPTKKGKKKRSKRKGKGKHRHQSRTTEEPKPVAPQGPVAPKVNALVMEEAEDDPLRQATGDADEDGEYAATRGVARLNLHKGVMDEYEGNHSESESDSDEYDDEDEDEDEDVKDERKVRGPTPSMELARVGLTKSQNARVEAHAHAMAEYIMVDTSFLVTPAFDIFLEMRGVWWGPGTDRTLVVPSCTFFELEDILSGALPPDGVPIPRVGVALLNLDRLMQRNELIRLDVDEIMDMIFEAYEMPEQSLLRTTFKMGCVLMERLIEMCPVPCLLSVLTRDPAFRVALSTFNDEAIEKGTISRRWLFETEPCWCPVQVRDGICPGDKCPYVHRDDPESFTRNAHPQCPKETLGYICEDPKCPWHHIKRAIATPPTPPKEPAPAPTQTEANKPSEPSKQSEPSKPSYLKGGHRRKASVIVMKMPSYLANKGQKPAKKSTEPPKKPSADLLKPTVTQIVTGRNAVLEMSRRKAEARAIDNARRVANYGDLIQGLSSLQFSRQFALSQQKKDKGVVTEGCDESEWDDY